jgi:hypothetical protein
MHRSFEILDFSTGNYFHLLDILSSDGYATMDFSTVDPIRKHLVLRHDIDFDMDVAATLARKEQEHGYSATYFVMLGSEFYNPLSGSGREALASIASYGHKIGLHFDVAIYGEDDDALTLAAEKECRILEMLSGQAVKVISMHRPPAKLIGENVNFAGRLNTYAPRFTKDMGYCSDSRGAWHYGSPLESDAVQQGRALQLLTHPIWWIQGASLSPQQTVAGFLRNRQEFLGREAERNCTAYTHVSGSA